MVDKQFSEVASEAGPLTAARPAGPSLWRHRDFRLFVVGQMISTCGDMFFVVAMPFLIFGNGGGTSTLTATLTVFGVTRLLVALPAGALADRIGPRSVMLGADVLRAGSVALLAVSAATGRPGLALLLGVSAALGIGEGCYRPASRSLTPLLVSDEQLPAANSLNISANVLASVVGPAVGGAGVVLGSSATMLGLDALTFVCSIVTLVLIAARPARAGAQFAAGDAGEPRTVVEFLRRSAFFRVVVLMNVVIGLSIAGALQVALPVLATQRPDLGPPGYGFLMTGLGLGLVLGGLSGGKLAGTSGQGRLVIGLLAANGGLLAALPNVSGLPGMLAVMVALGASDGALGVIVITVLQRLPPPHLRGRVLGVLSFVNFAMFPLSVLGAGSILATGSPALAIELSGVGVGLVAVIGAASAAVRRA